ncbi:MAG: phosphate ABC transporter substrate-binding protein [Gemmatimonadota bacterium]|nr:phosphate ABC transporter substrate-binding protein [Gemmatimonadota bacterium]
MKRLFTILGLPLVLLACGGGEDRTIIQNTGSDTLLSVAQGWAEAYAMVEPTVAIAVSGGGSGTGISSMINGTVDIANASRGMRESEFEAARAQGLDPQEHIVGYDALAIFLHPDNPLTSISLEQLVGIYGENGTIESWDQIGIEVHGCGSDEIVRVSRQNNSGTYAYFREAVLGESEFKLGSRDMHGSKDVVDLVENTPCAIGYSGLAYATDHISMPCVSAGEGTPCVAPSVDTAIDGSYTIARPLFMYTAMPPEGGVKQYMDWILSDEGQCIIFDKGYAPVATVTCA